MENGLVLFTRPKSGAQIAEENVCASYYKRRSDIRDLHSVSPDPWIIALRYFHAILADPAYIKQGIISLARTAAVNMMCLVTRSMINRLGEGGGRKEVCGEEISR